MRCLLISANAVDSEVAIIAIKTSGGARQFEINCSPSSAGPTSKGVFRKMKAVTSSSQREKKKKYSKIMQLLILRSVQIYTQKSNFLKIIFYVKKQKK